MALEAILKRAAIETGRAKQTAERQEPRQEQKRLGQAKGRSPSAFFQAAGIAQYDGSLVQTVARHAACVTGSAAARRPGKGVMASHFACATICGRILLVD